MDSFEKMAETVVGAVSRARTKILDVMAQPFDVEYKEDRSPVTAADMASQEVLVRVLQDSYPDIPIISEEKAAEPYAVRRQWDQLWLLDPLDGTKEFVRRNGEFTVNVALIVGERPVIGVLDWPQGGITYVAVAGAGSYRLSGGHTARIHTRPLSSPCRAIISRSHRQSEVDWLDSAGLGDHSLQLMGSALKFCRIAEGAADIYPRLTPNMEWDSAAGQLLIEEAGGKVVDFAGEPLHYNKQDLHNGGFIAVGEWETWHQYFRGHNLLQ